MIRLVSEPIDVETVIAAVASSGAGAVVVFVGTTRDHNAGRRVTELEYEAYSPMAEHEMDRIVCEAKERWPGAALAMVHRVGRVPVGEASVVIVTSAAHRDAAFAASRFAIDELKVRVPLWKKEHFAGGAVWIGHQAGPLTEVGPDEPAE